MAQTDFRLEVLPEAQRQLWSELGQFRDEFVLYGGTAIVLQLGHRESLDFDFFASRSFQPGTLKLKFRLLQACEVLQSAPDTLTVLKQTSSGNVKLSFFGGLGLARVRPPVASVANGVRVASLLDLAGTKIKVIQDRAELKDYLDISALLDNGIDLGDAVRAAMTIYGTEFNPMPSLKALTYFEDGDVRGLGVAVRKRLELAVTKLRIDGLEPFAAENPVFDAQAPRTQDINQAQET